MSMQVTASPQAYDYLLGNTDEEHERLIRQAARLEPVTAAFLREAGIAAGQRVLDVGSGVGDVAMLLARMVGNTGAVVGVERDAKSIARARSRVARAGFGNITFWEGDITECEPDGVFDAVVGRYVLQFLADPVAVLRRLSQSLRPGGGRCVPRVLICALPGALDTSTSLVDRSPADAPGRHPPWSSR